MKFLADMGISARTVATLREQGHDGVHAREVGLARASDATTREATPSVVIFRVRDQSPASITPRLLQVIAECSTDLDDGAIILVEDRRYRVRSLPIKR